MNPLGSGQSFLQMRHDVAQWSQRLAESVEKRSELADLHITHQGDEVSAASTPGHLSDIKRDLRRDLWNLGEKIKGQENSPDLKVSFEKLRNLAMDNTLEKELKGYPSQNYPVRPNPADLANFQIVADNFYRGGQPDPQGAEWLLQNGVTTEVDLRGDDRDNSINPPQWQPKKVFNIAMPDYGSPTFEQVEQFVDVINNPENGKVFVHCKAGIGRTGLMTACWRISQGMSADDALALENINCFAGALKQEDFVRDFEVHWKSKKTTTGQTSAN